MTRAKSDREHADINKRHELGFSLYQGRVYMGRLVKTGNRCFEAVDARDRLLGEFRSRRAALAAIRAAWAQAT